MLIGQPPPGTRVPASEKARCAAEQEKPGSISDNRNAKTAPCRSCAADDALKIGGGEASQQPVLGIWGLGQSPGTNPHSACC